MAQSRTSIIWFPLKELCAFKAFFHWLTYGARAFFLRPTNGCKAFLLNCRPRRWAIFTRSWFYLWQSWGTYMHRIKLSLWWQIWDASWLRRALQFFWSFFDFSQLVAYFQALFVLSPPEQGMDLKSSEWWLSFRISHHVTGPQSSTEFIYSSHSKNFASSDLSRKYNENSVGIKTTKLRNCSREHSHV